MVLCKCGHEQSKHTTNGCVGCSARCRKFEAFVITEEEKVRRQEIIATKLKQAAEIPVAVQPEEEPEAPEETIEKEITKSWVCADCDSEYETKKEAKDDGCDVEDPPFLQYVCECGNRFDSMAEAKECTCESSESSGSSSEGGTGLGMGGIVQMMMMFVVMIIVLSVGSTVISSIQPMAASSGASPQAMTAISAAMPLMSSIIPLVVGVGILLTVLTYITGSGTRS